MAPDMVRMPLGVTAKEVIHSIAGFYVRGRMTQRTSQRIDFHTMIKQHPSSFQQTSVVPPDGGQLCSILTEKLGELSMAAGQRRGLRAICVHALDAANFGAPT